MSNKILMPREKLLQEGATALSDSELLAIFLRIGIKGKPVMILAEQVLREFGSLRGLLTADLEQFCQIKGLGSAKYVQLQAAKEMTKRYLAQSMEKTEMLTNPALVVMYLQAELEMEEREIVMVLFLDSQNRVIHSERMFQGTIGQAVTYPREIVKTALRYNASGLIVAHNHPSGDCTPSQSDRKATERIREACELVDLRFIDHIIVGKGDYFSFKEDAFEQEFS